MSNLGMNQLYGNSFINPYTMGNNYSQALNSDFMLAATQGYNPYSSANGLQAYQQPTTDQFIQTAPQQTSGGSGFGTGVALGLTAGGATGAAVYKWGSNPITNGNVSEKLIQQLDHAKSVQSASSRFSQLYNKEVNSTLNTIKKGLTKDQYLAVQQLARAESIDDLADAVKSKLPKDVQSPKAAKKLVTKAQPALEKIDINALKDKACKLNSSSLASHTNKLKQLQARQELVNKIPNNANKAEIAKYIKANAEGFGIKGNEKAIDKAVKNIVDNLDSKDKLVKHFANKIKNQEKQVTKISEKLANGVKNYWDDAANTFKKGTPENITKIAKNFKLKTAGKWGAIAAGVGLAIGWIFGGNKS